MDRTIYGFVFRHSLRRQMLLLVLTVASFPVLYSSLELPKIIINEAIQGTEFPKAVLGREFDQIPFLIAASLTFLGLVLLNGAFKFAINTSKGRLGERLLRRLRFELYSRVLRFPLSAFKRTSQGEIIPMITQEVEPLGGFMGDALAQPVYQLGVLLTIATFMLVQEPMLGLAAMALYPLQIYVIPRLQRRVNLLAKERVRNVRSLSDRIGESITVMEAVRANDNSNHRRADVAERLGIIYDIRYEIFRRKFFIKFLNNFLAQVTPFFFYLLGGYLIIRGDLSFGAMVAVLAAYKDMSAPWKELLAYYQQQADARIKYEQVVRQFDPSGLVGEDRQPMDPGTLPVLGPGSRIEFRNATYAEEDAAPEVEGVGIAFGFAEHVALVGPGGGGKEALAMLAAGLAPPTGGAVLLDGASLSDLPEAVFGRQAAYVGPSPDLFAGTVRDNVLAGLRHRPVRPAEYAPEEAARRARQLVEARRAGNTDADFRADWTDYARAGIGPGEPADGRIVALLGTLGLADDLYAFGLRGTPDPARHRDLVGKALEARGVLKSLLDDPAFASLIEPFDETAYNTSATLAQNLLFGEPVGPEFEPANLAANPFVRRVLGDVGLLDRLQAIGLEAARIMVEIFADVDPGHELFEQYSFIRADELPDFRAIVGRAGHRGIDGLDADERTRLLGLPFLLIPERHRLGLIDGEIQSRILNARTLFRIGLPEDQRGLLEFFDTERYVASASLQDNILFGRIRFGQARSAAKVGRLLAHVVDRVGMRDAVTMAGLDHHVGVGGGRLNRTQRRQIAFARALVKRPEFLIVNMATAGVDRSLRATLLDAVLRGMDGRGVLWALEEPELAAGFGRVVVLRDGRVVGDGDHAVPARPGGPLAGTHEAQMPEGGKRHGAE